MLSVDIVGLSDAELKQVVKQCCGLTGTVISAIVYRAIDAQAWPLALVEMSNASESSRLATELGDAIMGNAVLIRLQQKVRVPAFLRRPATLP
jgi:hypothetical protein